MKKITLLFLLGMCFSCSSDELCEDLPALPEKQRCAGPMDQMGLTALELMDLYVVENDLENDVIKRSDDLWYIVHEEGGTDRPNITETVRVGYVGYFRNDCRFDSSDDVSFGLSNLIDAWRIGIPLVGKCGSITLIVPPKLGYGTRPPTGIPRGEPLIFDIHLLDF